MRTLVTGASRGIGRAIALHLAASRPVVAVVRRSEDARSLLDESQGAIASIELELTDREARARIIGEAERSFGPIDALVHAAGLGEHRALADIDPAQIDRLLEVNVVAGLALARGLALSIRARGARGSFLFFSSTLATRPAAGTIVYSMTKGAVASMTRALALELAADGIRVNALAPGVVDTDMVRAPRLAPGEPMPSGEARRAREEEQLAALARLHPIGRVGTASELAVAAAYLLDAEFATGSILTLDGGLSLA